MFYEKKFFEMFFKKCLFIFRRGAEYVLIPAGWRSRRLRKKNIKIFCSRWTDVGEEGCHRKLQGAMQGRNFGRAEIIEWG
jgi:hypothetical protein